MARSRERRQRGTQYTGVLRSRNRTVEERTQQHGVERRQQFRWRLVSGLLVLGLSFVLVMFFVSDAFYVHSVNVNGLRYMTVEEVFTYADIANAHIFWVEPDQVRDNLVGYPTVADAVVQLGWPPNMVNITIEEREPALIWEQNGVAVWVDIQGNVMVQREERPDLVRIAVQNPLVDGPLGESGYLDTDVVYGVLQLQGLRPDIRVWNYDPVSGLGFQAAQGWAVWLGVGTDMPEKMQIYEALSSDIIARGIQTLEVNIVDPDAPFRTDIWGQ